VLSKPSISELTVEDPAEAFEDLRDRNDLAMLLGHAAFMSEGFGDGVVSHGGGRVKRTTGRAAAQGRTKGKAAGGKLGPPADRAWLERWRKDLKIAGVRISITALALKKLLRTHNI
jgi:histone acetyltransferase 1